MWRRGGNGVCARRCDYVVLQRRSDEMSGERAIAFTESHTQRTPPANPQRARSVTREGRRQARPIMASLPWSISLPGVNGPNAPLLVGSEVYRLAWTPGMNDASATSVDAEMERGDVVVELRGDGLAGDKLRAHARDERELRNAPLITSAPTRRTPRLAETLAFRGRVRLGEPHRLGGGDGVTTRRAGRDARARGAARGARRETARARRDGRAEGNGGGVHLVTRPRECASLRDDPGTFPRVDACASRRRALRRWMKFGKRAGDEVESLTVAQIAHSGETRGKSRIGRFFGEDRFAIRMRTSLNFARDDDVECGVHHRGFATGAQARTPTGARTTRITWKRAIGRFESGIPSCTRARGREVRAPSSPPARRGTLATHFSPEAPRAPPVTQTTSPSRLASERADAGIAPDLRPTERAPKTQDRALRAHPVTAPRDGRNLAGASSPRAPRNARFLVPVEPPTFPSTSSLRDRRPPRAPRPPRRTLTISTSPPSTAGLRASVRAQNLDPRVAPSFAPRTQVRPFLPSA